MVDKKPRSLAVLAPKGLFCCRQILKTQRAGVLRYFQFGIVTVISHDNKWQNLKSAKLTHHRLRLFLSRIFFPLCNLLPNLRILQRLGSEVSHDRYLDLSRLIPVKYESPLTVEW